MMPQWVRTTLLTPELDLGTRAMLNLRGEQGQIYCTLRLQHINR